jgi:fatty-acyl-CoA synthase
MSAVSASQDHEHYVHKILSVLAREPARTVITTPTVRLTAEVFAGSILAAAALLRGHGVAPGSAVAILTEPNHPHMLTIRYAAHLLGATTVYIRSNNARSEDDMLPAADQAHMLAEAGAELLVTDQANIGRGRELCQRMQCQAVAADLDRVGDPAGDAAGSPGGSFDARYEPGDRLVITYTSGTTGRPKGVCHSYRGWNNMAAGFEAVVRGSSPPTFLAVTPVSQTVGVMVDGTLAAGGSLVVHERFSVEEVLRDFAGLGITDCYLAVPHLYELTAHPLIADQDLSRLRHVVYSGSPAAPHRMAEAARVFGRALLQSYGSTEAGPVTYLGAWEHRDADLLTTVGRPYPGVRVRVCQRDPRRELPTGRTGQIWVRSGNVMEEYLGDPGLTAKVLREGWLRTGDLGHVDHAGYLTLTGRIGEVIKNGGLKVYPATVERALMMHPDVYSAAVIGIRQRKDYEEAYAAVILQPGTATTLRELRSYLDSAVARAQAPAVLAVWAELPADESGKVDKRQLRALVEGGDGASHGLLAEEAAE